MQYHRDVSSLTAIREQLAKTLITFTALNILIKVCKIIRFNMVLRRACITAFFDERGFAEHQSKIWGH